MNKKKNIENISYAYCISIFIWNLNVCRFPHKISYFDRILLLNACKHACISTENDQHKTANNSEINGDKEKLSGVQAFCRRVTIYHLLGITCSKLPYLLMSVFGVHFASRTLLFKMHVRAVFLSQTDKKKPTLQYHSMCTEIEIFNEKFLI